MESTATAEISALMANTSARTLTLGIDKTGRIRQHDRLAADVLCDEPAALLGTDLGSLLAGSEAHAATLQGLIDGACSGREGTAVLKVRTARGTAADGVVTVQPVRSADPELVAQVILRIPPPLEERFLDPAVMRHAMLDGALRRIGGELDMDQMAPELINILVPHFCNSAGLLIRESLIGDEDMLAETTGRVAAGPAAGGGPRQRRRRLGRDVPGRRGAALPAGHAVHAVHGDRPAGLRDDRQRERGPDRRARGSASRWPSCWAAPRC